MHKELIILFALLVLVKSNCDKPPPSACNLTSNHPLHVQVMDKVLKWLPDHILPPPQLIQGVPLITFTQPFQVQIMFLQNNGSFKNQLGYFTVSTSRPDTIVEHKLVFLDTSTECLSTGAFVLLGPFDQSTMVGFYIVSNGWCGGTDLLYSYNKFNNESIVLSAVFFDRDSNTLVVGMEDLPGRVGDDYQDVVFQVDTNPALEPNDFKGDVPFICDSNCDNCNFTTGNCIYQFRRRSLGLILSVTFGLAVLLIIAIGVIIYLIRKKNVGRGVLPEGWFPVSNSLADQLQYEDKKTEDLVSEEDNL